MEIHNFIYQEIESDAEIKVGQHYKESGSSVIWVVVHLLVPPNRTKQSTAAYALHYTLVSISNGARWGDPQPDIDRVFGDFKDHFTQVKVTLNNVT